MPNNYKSWSPEKIKKWNENARKYSRAHYVTVSFKVNKDTEKDIVNYLYDENGKARGSISNTLKGLIRAPIEELFFWRSIAVPTNLLKLTARNKFVVCMRRSKRKLYKKIFNFVYFLVAILLLLSL